MKEIIREKDASFGIIPLQKHDGVWQVFIVQSITGHWGFPKGHPDHDSETPEQTAERELREETGFSLVAYYPAQSLSFSYECRSHGKYVDKTVTLFLAQVTGNIHPCPIEIAESIWVDLDDVESIVVFEPIQPLLKKLKEIVHGF
ncbi:NUDIX domain-containing protein [Candidatus Babeliales bacterium]|nr:NUDIX domain-containing protein [Candidatus Babeliales bacterium]MBP9844098.1 NUDIX domain-containing protein [Candidatus Babeliales bacterium]